MTQAKHTPGPWFTNTAGSAKRGEPFKITEIYVYAPYTQDDTAICADVIDPVTQEPSEANARLIAASPELLDALTRLANAAFARDTTMGDQCSLFAAQAELRDATKVAREAIAKATGVTT